jgi:hypothetical protein
LVTTRNRERIINRVKIMWVIFFTCKKNLFEQFYKYNNVQKYKIVAFG